MVSAAVFINNGCTLKCSMAEFQDKAVYIGAWCKICEFIRKCIYERKFTKLI